MPHQPTIDLLSDPRIPHWLAAQMAAVGTDARRARITGDVRRVEELRGEAEALAKVAAPYLALPMPEPPVAPPEAQDELAAVAAMIDEMEAETQAPKTSLPARYRTRYDPGYLAPVSTKPRPWTVVAVVGGLLLAVLGAGAWFLRRR